MYQKKNIKDHRSSNNKYSKSIANILEAKLAEFGIDRARYHDGDLEGTSIIRLFQNANKVFNQFSMAIKNIITNEEQKKEVEEYTMRFIEIFTLFDSLFSLSRTLTGKMTSEIIDKLEIVLEKPMLCWRNLRLSTKMVKIHGIEDHLLNQIKKYNGIGCFIEDFIEQAHQLGMLDKKRTENIRDRTKASFSSSKNETISNNGEVKLKIEQVRDLE